MEWIGWRGGVDSHCLCAAPLLPQSRGNFLFTTSRPLAFFLERLALLSAHHRVVIDVSHIAGEVNDKADALSRPLERSHPADCLAHERLRFSLSNSWAPTPNMAVSPPGASVKWPLPVGVPNV